MQQKVDRRRGAALPRVPLRRERNRRAPCLTEPAALGVRLKIQLLSQRRAYQLNLLNALASIPESMFSCATVPMTTRAALRCYRHHGLAPVFSRNWWMRRQSRRHACIRKGDSIRQEVLV